MKGIFKPKFQEMKFELDFQMVEFRPDGSVAGRNCGGTLSIGTIFTAVGRRVFPVLKPEDDISDPGLEFVCAISLRLDSIEMYRRQFDFLSPGMTGWLGLSGTGFSTVQEMLARSEPHTYYSLLANINESGPHIN